MRADALESILKNYNALQALWVESIDSAKVTDMKAHSRGCITDEYVQLFLVLT